MKNPLIPMGAVTGSMTRAQVRKMLEAYRAAGIEQYLFYARGGCTIPFMGGEWLALCENIVRECERLGMDVWLYDEYDCPSGTCHGTVLRDHPEYLCGGVDRKGRTVRGTGYLPMADLLNPDCVELFIERTYEKLYARLKPFFGTVIKGVFTDEPSMGCSLSKGAIKTHPYTPGIEKEYRRRFGDDLFAGIRANDPDTLEKYYALLAERFCGTCIDRLAGWCEERGVLLTGHLLEESSVRSASVANGNLIRALRGFSMPGIDEISTRIGTRGKAEWITLGAIAAAANRNGALAELGALGPCDQPLSRYLQMIRQTALFGVDHYVLAVAAADARGGVVKTDWLHPTGMTQPQFECYQEFGELAKQAAGIAAKTPEAEVAVVYPAREAARYITETENTVDDKLIGLIDFLNLEHYVWALIDEADRTPDGALRVTYDTPVEEIRRNRLPKHSLTETDGTLAAETLLRAYTDGTVCVLNTEDGGEERWLRLDGKLILLRPRGLYVSEAERQGKEEIIAVKQDEGVIMPAEGRLRRYKETEWRMRLDRPVTRRCVFHADRLTYKFRAAEKTPVRLYIRSFGKSGTVTLDGKPAGVLKPCRGLTPGYRELYGQTEKTVLEPGMHEVTVSEIPDGSEPYLPSVFIAGRFEDGPDGIKPLRGKYVTGEALEERLPEFCGVITFEADISVPLDARKLALHVDGCEQCMKAYLDGEPLGTAVEHPYCFTLPRKCGGRVRRLKIEQYTTVGALFGKRAEVLRGIDKKRVLHRFFPGRYSGRGIRGMRLEAWDQPFEEKLGQA